MAGAGALGGAFWGMLFGLIFFMPFFGLAIGASDRRAGRPFHRLRHRRQVHRADALEGHRRHLGAVPADPERGHGQGPRAAQGLKPELISTNLSKEQEDELKAAFGEEETPAGETPAGEAPAGEAPAA